MDRRLSLVVLALVASGTAILLWPAPPGDPALDRPAPAALPVASPVPPAPRPAAHPLARRDPLGLPVLMSELDRPVFAAARRELGGLLDALQRADPQQGRSSPEFDALERAARELAGTAAGRAALGLALVGHREGPGAIRFVVEGLTPARRLAVLRVALAAVREEPGFEAWQVDPLREMLVALRSAAAARLHEQAIADRVLGRFFGPTALDDLAEAGRPANAAFVERMGREGRVGAADLPAYLAALARVAPERAMPVLLQHARGSNARLRELALEHLTLVDTPSAVPALRSLLVELRGAERFAVAAALARLGQRDGWEVVLGWLVSEDPRRQQRADAVLQETFERSMGYRPGLEPDELRRVAALWREVVERRLAAKR